MNKSLILGLTLLFCIPLFSAHAQIPRFKGEKIAKIAGRNVPVRIKPFDEAPVLLLLRNGQFVKAKAEFHNGYFHVETLRGTDGWIATEYLLFGPWTNEDFTTQRERKNNNVDHFAFGHLTDKNYALKQDTPSHRTNDPRFHKMYLHYAGGKGFAPMKDVTNLTQINEVNNESFKQLEWTLRTTMMERWSGCAAQLVTLHRCWGLG